MVYRSKALQDLFGSKQTSPYDTASDIAKLKTEVARLKLKVEELTGERGKNPAVRANEAWVTKAKELVQQYIANNSWINPWGG
jgi:phage shock protein A